jgi:hypothetical protein
MSISRTQRKSGNCVHIPGSLSRFREKDSNPSFL